MFLHVHSERFYVLLCYKFSSIYEQISLVNMTGNQQSVNICYYLLITPRYGFMAAPMAGGKCIPASDEGQLGTGARCHL